LDLFAEAYYYNDPSRASLNGYFYIDDVPANFSTTGCKFGCAPDFSRLVLAYLNLSHLIIMILHFSHLQVLVPKVGMKKLVMEVVIFNMVILMKKVMIK
jgi:hypothetical protein